MTDEPVPVLLDTYVSGLSEDGEMSSVYYFKGFHRMGDAQDIQFRDKMFNRSLEKEASDCESMRGRGWNVSTQPTRSILQEISGFFRPANLL
jgi:hypothetical protein